MERQTNTTSNITSSGADPEGGFGGSTPPPPPPRQIFPQKYFFASIFNRMENLKFKQ